MTNTALKQPPTQAHTHIHTHQICN